MASKCMTAACCCEALFTRERLGLSLLLPSRFAGRFGIGEWNRTKQVGFVLGSEPDQLVAAMGSSHDFLIENAAITLGWGDGTVAHEHKASAVSRRVCELMAAW